METAFFPWKRYLGYSFAALALIFAYSWITSPMLVSVTGQGEVTAAAETATLTFTVSANSDSPQAALAQVKETSNRIKQNLATTGIPESSVYESQAAVVPASAVVQGGTGFQATISMGIKTGQVNNLDGIINNLYSQGAAIVSQPVLTVGNIAELERQAYNMAIKDAKKKAGSVALSNLKLFRKIVLIQESQTQPSSTVTTKADTASQIENNISPDDGLIKISKVVSVSYKLW